MPCLLYNGEQSAHVVAGSSVFSQLPVSLRCIQHVESPLYDAIISSLPPHLSTESQQVSCQPAVIPLDAVIFLPFLKGVYHVDLRSTDP